MSPLPSSSPGHHFPRLYRMSVPDSPPPPDTNTHTFPRQLLGDEVEKHLRTRLSPPHASSFLFLPVPSLSPSSSPSSLHMILTVRSLPIFPSCALPNTQDNKPTPRKITPVPPPLASAL
ncbi:hypothetical protein E2C01_052342 [Portunus trituberculatus]|uniref:Uncharacterized protein n=1 Tax=Portunus trituberculatus TaxID=210409 RepID=A0A5B7GLL5_PORTR|nr:hypothetical protein [Portunus trituberculatus]